MTEDVLVATLFAAFAITFAAFQLARMARSWWQDRQDRAAFAALGSKHTLSDDVIPGVQGENIGFGLAAAPNAEKFSELNQ